MKKKKVKYIIWGTLLITFIILFIRYYNNLHPCEFAGSQYMEGEDIVIELKGEKYYYIDEDLWDNMQHKDKIYELKNSTVNELNKLELLITSFPIHTIEGDEEGDFIIFSKLIGKYKGVYAKKEAIKKMENWREGEVTAVKIRCYNGRRELTEESENINFFEKLNNYKGREVKIPKDYENQDFARITFYYNNLPFYEEKYRLIKYNEKYYYFIEFDSSEGREEGKVKQVCTEITEPEIIQVIKGLFQGEYDEYQFKRPE